MAVDKANKIIALLKNEYSEINIALHYSNPLELLVATILSAQCPDKQVNAATKKLFAKYQTLQDFVGISQEELENMEELIRLREWVEKPQILSYLAHSGK
jgi:endonuclease-3